MNRPLSLWGREGCSGQPGAGDVTRCLRVPGREGFERPITSETNLEPAARRPIFATAQALMPRFPRSASQEGFDHSPITSTVLSE